MVSPGSILQDRYQIARLIKQGGAGAVYLAEHIRLHTKVALKQSIYSNEGLLKEFEREASLLAKLSHPGVPIVFDHFIEDYGHFLVMQFIPGDDLGRMLEQRGGPFQIQNVLTWADQLLDILEYLHSQEPPVIHRDIKPENLKLTKDSHIVLLDFGLAKGASKLSLHGATPAYAPKEQLLGIGTDARSDLYSLAVTVYELITGMQPPSTLARIESANEGHPDPVRPASEINPDVPSHVADVLMQAMSQDRDRRPAGAAEMRRALLDKGGLHLSIDVQAAMIASSPCTLLLGVDERTRTARESIERPKEHEKERSVIEESRSQVSTEAIVTSLAIPSESNRDMYMKRAMAMIVLAFIGVAGWQVYQILNMRPPAPDPPKPDITIVTRTDNFARIEAGEFMMGSDSYGLPAHLVRISRPFEMGKYEVTQIQWETVMGTNPSEFKGENRPVTLVSWEDVQQFIRKLNARNDGYIYRLPTEAEWEYACRAGNAAAWEDDLDSLAWYDVNSQGEPHQVGQKKPNAWGLYDMYGNVSEHCQDWFNETYYARSPVVDPQGPSSGSYKVGRGCDCKDPWDVCRPTDRFIGAPDSPYPRVGFRLVRTIRR